MILLSIAAMEANGVFQSPARWVTVGCGDVVVRVRFDPETGRVFVAGTDECVAFDEVLDLSEIGLKFGTRRYLECPNCSARSTFLVQFGRSVRCWREQLGKGMLDRHTERQWLREKKWLIAFDTASITKRRRLIAGAPPKLRQLAEQFAAESSIDAVDRATIFSRSRAAKETNPLGTSEGLRLGRAAADYELFHEYKNASKAALVPWDELPSGWKAPDRPDYFDIYPELDIRALAKVGYLKPGVLLATRLGWDRTSTMRQTILVISDQRTGAGPAILLASLEGEAVTGRQRVKLVPRSAGSERAAFLCPVTHQPAEILYLRNGTFASRKAQRLYHPSQRRR